MKSNKKVLLAGGSAVLVGGCLVVGLCSQHLRKKSPMLNLVFPPRDIYHPLAQIPFSTSSADKEYTSLFTTKYPGRHSIEVIVTKPVKVMEAYGEAFTVGVAIKDEAGAVLVDRMIAPPYSPFWGISESGLKLLNFKTPDDVPLGNPLEVYVKVKTKDGSFESKHGPLELRIVKVSDE